MKLSKVVIALSLFMLFSICLANAQVPYYVDSSNNVWVNISSSGTSPQYYTINNTGGSFSSGTATFPMFDDFTKDSALNTDLWTPQYGVSGTVAISNNALLVDGTPLSSTSGNAVSSYTWTNGTELILNQSLSNDYYSDVSFGSGSLTQAGGWYHTMLSTNGGSFILQGLSGSVGYRDSSAPGTGTTPTYTYNSGSLGTSGVSLNTPFTVGYSYDNGNASERLYTESYPNTSVRCIMAQTGSGAQNHVSGAKQWMISQGEYNAGHGGARTINTAWIRNTAGSDSAISFTTINGNRVLVVNPTVSSGYMQLEIPSAMIAASNVLDIEPMQAPIASFTSVNTSNVFSFTDTSTNNPALWSWNFGDGQTSTQQNPTHTYSANGTYTVSLTATNTVGSSTPVTSSVLVTVPGVQSQQQIAKEKAGSSIISLWGSIVSFVTILIVIILFWQLNGFLKGTVKSDQMVGFVIVGGSMVMIIAIVSYILYLLLTLSGAT